MNTPVPWRSARIAAHCSRQMLPWRRSVAPAKFRTVTVRLDTLREIHHSAVAWVVRKTFELFRNASGWPLSGQGKAFGFQEKSWSTVACGASFLVDFVFRHEPGAGAFDLLEGNHSLQKRSQHLAERDRWIVPNLHLHAIGAALDVPTGTSRLFRCQV